MPNYNSITLIGHVTRDPELSYTNTNVAICKFGLATNYKYKDTEEVLFVDCTLFAKQAETFKQYVAKGHPVLIEGRLKLDRWDAADGTKRSKHCIVVNRFVFLKGKDDNAVSPRVQRPEAATVTVSLNDEDVPF